MLLTQITSIKPLQRGATSLLEILFVIVVACAFALGVYRQFSMADIEKSALQLNQQLMEVTKIANIFYFSVDPSTKNNNPPIRFCNQTGGTGSTSNVFNVSWEIGTIVQTKLCPSSTDGVCGTLINLSTQLINQASKHNYTFLIVLGQTDPTAGTPKFIAILLHNTAQNTSASDITNEETFQLYKGKLAGNPQFVKANTAPFSLGSSYQVKQNSILWIIPPSQGNLTLLGGSKLSNVNMNILNELAGAMSARKPLPSDNYALACRNTYKPPATTQSN